MASQYYIITYGCQMNKSDSEKIAALLQRQGHKPAKNENEANLIVLNACSVRQSAIDRVYAKVNQYYKNKRSLKKVILAGCLLAADKNKLKNKVTEFWHPDKYFYKESLRGAPPPAGGGAPQQSRPNNAINGIAALSGTFREGCRDARHDKTMAYVPIMTGCNNFCSYCVVPYTRGREKSKPADEILDEVRALIKKGCKEIILIGQNVNSYQFKNQKSKIKITIQNLKFKKGGTRHSERSEKSPACARPQNTTIDFPMFLKNINALPGDFCLSFMTSHPKDMTDELIEAMARCEKLVKEIHLPVQSGDNQILKKMNRHYTAKQYENLIKKIRKQIPDIKISTDIIVGFPGETKKQFQNTAKLAKTIKFDKAYIAKYSPRPNTAAAKLKDDVPSEEKKQRWRILDTLINKFEH